MALDPDEFYWDDLLPEYPADIADADAEVVADALMASYGGSRKPA